VFFSLLHSSRHHRDLHSFPTRRSSDLEPYRMFTSRAEYRLLLRHDNADRRLTPLARRAGLVSDAAWQRLQRKEQGITALTEYLRSHRHGQDTLERCLRRTEMAWVGLCELEPMLR